MKFQTPKLIRNGQVLAIIVVSVFFSSLLLWGKDDCCTDKPIRMEAAQWQTERDVRFWEFEGKSAMGLKGSFMEPGVATLMGIDFQDGVIEFDMWTEFENSMFTGIQFRVDEADENYEYVYFRPPSNNQANAFQYCPHYNNAVTWQLHGQHQRALDLPVGDWFHFRIEVHGRSMTCTFGNQKQPFFFTDRLGSGSDHGRIRFVSSSEVYVANMKVSPSEAMQLPPFKASRWDLDPRYLTAWKVSQPILLEQGEGQVGVDRFVEEDTILIHAEDRGLISFSRYLDQPGRNSAVLAEVEIHSDREQSKQLSFGYSDRIDLYLNGELIFSGDNTYMAPSSKMRSRVHLGNDFTELKLSEGMNTLQAIVYERGGGWGMIAQLSDLDGIDI